jgi:paraquat-inducible protein B
MSRQASSKMIGAFVVGAFVLVVAAIVTFGSIHFMTESFTMVAYFEGSLKGLNVGAPILFQGAPIGSVTSIRVQYDAQEGRVRLPVLLKITRENIEIVDEGLHPEVGSGIQRLIENRGLKAQLVIQSMITGQQVIELGFHPDVPIELTGMMPEYLEVPTIPSLQAQLENLFKKLKDVPLNDTIEDIRRAVRGVDELVRSPEIKKAIVDLDDTLLAYKKLADDVDAKVEPLSDSLEETLESARVALGQARTSIAAAEEVLDGTLTDARKLVNHVDQKVDPLSASFEDGLEKARSALVQARTTLATADELLRQDSPTIQYLNEALTQLSATLRSIRRLADYLEQHPEALFKGKGVPGA